MSELSKQPVLNGNANDPRVSYSQLNKKWIYEDEETGLEYEYNEALKDWVPVLTEEAISLQQKAYEQQSNDANNEGEAKADGEEASDTEESKRKKKRPKTDGKSGNTKHKPRNTGIYLSNLPLSVTKEELEQTFSKYGVIAEDFDTAEKKIKIYLDEETQRPKGDALIIYFKPESVDLAIQMMDGVALRFDKDAQKISVTKAEFKKNDMEDQLSVGERPKKTLDAQSKLKIQRQMQKLNSKLVDWDDDIPEEEIPKRWQKTMLLKHVFTPTELQEDLAAATDIKEDIIQGCEEIGPVTNATLYDLEPEGIVLVKFQKKEDVKRAVETMDGRFFGGRKLEASTYDGNVKYMRTRKGDEDEKEEEKRLEEFGEWISKESKESE